MAKSSSTAVISPSYGLKYDAPPLGLRDGYIQEGLNFRVKEGRLTNINLGWTRFSTFQLNGPVRLIDNFFSSVSNEHVILGSETDLYRYDPGDDAVYFITPAYVTGSVTVSTTAITMAGGTNLGDMTGGGGINAAFDGTTDQAEAASASKAASTTTYIGRTPVTPSKVGGAIVYGSNNSGYVNGANPSVTITLYGKTGSAPANATDGTAIGSVTFTDTADEHLNPRTISSTNLTTTWTHMWVKVTQAGAAATMAVAEVQFYPPADTLTGSGTDWDPYMSVGDQIRFGSTTENDPLDEWYTISARASDTSATLDSSTKSAIYPAGTTYTLRRLFTGSADDIWTYDTFVNVNGTETRWYASNGVDNLVKWNGTDTFATKLDSFGITKIKALAVYNNMMVYGNFEQSGTHFPSSIINSDTGNPEDIVSGISEQFQVHSETSDIIALYTLADNLVIYSQRVLVVAQFVGDPLIFTFRTATTGVGPLSANAVADYGDYHNFLGFDSQYKFDGVTLVADNPQVWREIIRRNDPVRRASAFAHFDEENGDLIWTIALNSDAAAGTTGGSPERAFVQHYLEQGDGDLMPFSQRSFPFTVGGYYTRQDALTWDQLTQQWSELNFRWNDQFFSIAFPLNLMGDTDGKVWMINTSQNKGDGSGLESFVRFGRKATGDGKMRAMVRRIYPFVEAESTPLDVTLRLTDHGAGPITTTETYSFDQSLPEGGHFISAFRRGRFFELEFGTNGASLPWILEGYDVEVTPGGYR